MINLHTYNYLHDFSLAAVWRDSGEVQYIGYAAETYPPHTANNISSNLLTKLSEALVPENCPINRIMITNQLGGGKVLGYKCSNWLRREWQGSLRTFNQNKSWEFTDVIKIRKRSRYECDLWFGARKEFHFDELQIYRAASRRRCNIIRQWAARPDGIWFRKDHDKPILSEVLTADMFS
ncbi:hypothetical protein YC2023_091559 [Brassica napus]